MIITFSNFKEHTCPLFKELLISPLVDINNKAIALFKSRYFSNNLPPSFNDFFCLNKDVHQYNTRSSSNIHKIQARTNYQKYSVKYKGVSICNNLPQSVKEIKTFSLSGQKIKTLFFH